MVGFILLQRVRGIFPRFSVKNTSEYAFLPGDTVFEIVDYSRYVAVHPAGLHAHHASQLADCNVLVFHRFAPLKNSSTVKRPSLKYEDFSTDFLSEDSYFF